MQNKKGGISMKQKWFSLFPIIALIVMLAVPQTVSAISEDDIQAMLNTLNDRLATAGEDVQVDYVDLQTVDEIGIRVYANNREHQLSSHWFPYDPWRWGAREIFWMIDNVDQTTDVPWEDAYAAIGRAMNTWNTVPCATIPLVQWDDNTDWGYVQYWYWYDPDAEELPGHNGGINGWAADITHAGWLPAGFWDTIWGPGGGDNILGVTFTFTWTAFPGRVAFREIYYNEVFDWKINERYYDIETVVAHEVGHGLSLGHFGMIFRSPNGKLHFAPRALMNAIYYDILHELLGTDNASFCSIWAKWPNH
jgi:hypothetical protein